MPLLIALVILGLAAYDAFLRRPSFVLASLVVLADSIAHAARWVGISDPAVAWALLGVLGGSVAGLVVALRRGGRLRSYRPLRVGWLVLGGALLAADNVPAVQQPAGPAPIPRANVAIRMRVLADRVRVRAAPSARAAAVGWVPGRTLLDVLRTSADGNWVYVESRRDARLVRGWVRRLSLSLDTLDVRPTHATEPDSVPERNAQPDSARVDSTTPEPSTPRDDRVRRPDTTTTRTPDSTSAAPSPDTAASTPARAPKPVRPSSGDVGESVDHAAVADVQSDLRTARARASTGDYPAALRALAAADEGVTLATAKYGQLAWTTALQREAAAARAAVRTSCTAAVATATSRGEVPPRCD